LNILMIYSQLDVLLCRFMHHPTRQIISERNITVISLMNFWPRFFNCETSKWAQDIKMILTRPLLDIFVCKDINETTICCIKTLGYLLLVLELLACVVGAAPTARSRFLINWKVERNINSTIQPTFCYSKSWTKKSVKSCSTFS
jgi:hypothetical protein